MPDERSSPLYVLIMAGGLGKRMKSSLPKVLQLVADRPMLVRVIETAFGLNPDKVAIIVGKYQHVIKTHLAKYLTPEQLERIDYIYQDPPLGTGHAIQQALPYLRKLATGHVLILSGDVPLIQLSTLKAFIYGPSLNRMSVHILAALKNNPTGCGRLIWNYQPNNSLRKRRLTIVEEADCDANQRKNRLVNTGIYFYNSQLLLDYLPLLKNDNKQKEYYLTDLLSIAQNHLSERELEIRMTELVSDQIWQVSNINTPEQLKTAQLKFISMH